MVKIWYAVIFKGLPTMPLFISGANLFFKYSYFLFV